MLRTRAPRTTTFHNLLTGGIATLGIVATPAVAKEDAAATRLPASCLGVEDSVAKSGVFDRRHVVGAAAIIAREGKQQRQVTRGATLALVPEAGDSAVLLESTDKKTAREILARAERVYERSKKARQGN
ncbi:MAG: hypothetical protein ACO3JL_01390 [Myxococcota bacterium]